MAGPDATDPRVAGLPLSTAADRGAAVAGGGRRRPPQQARSERHRKILQPGAGKSPIPSATINALAVQDGEPGPQHGRAGNAKPAWSPTPP